MRTGMIQFDLANLMGYEQAYVSAIELGLKPPSREFLDRLVKALAFGERDLDEMETAVKQSQRRFVLPPEVPSSTCC